MRIIYSKSLPSIVLLYHLNLRQPSVGGWYQVNETTEHTVFGCDVDNINGFFLCMV